MIIPACVISRKMEFWQVVYLSRPVASFLNLCEVYFESRGHERFRQGGLMVFLEKDMVSSGMSISSMEASLMSNQVGRLFMEKGDLSIFGKMGKQS